MTVTLYEGDCVQIVPTLPPQSVDAIITDIPYGTTACKWDTIIPFHDFMTINGKQYEKDVAFDLLVDHYSLSEDEAAEKWRREHKPGMWQIVKRVLKPRGAFVTTASNPFAAALIMSNPDWFKYDAVWNKGHTGMFAVSKYRLLSTHENILIFGDGVITYNPQMRTGQPYIEKPRKNERKNNHKLGTKSRLVINNGTRFPITIIDINSQSAECNNTSRLHPTQKPVALYEYLIKTYTNEGDTVLDITMGSGTTGIACINTGRNFIGIEKDAAIFKIAERRINQV